MKVKHQTKNTCKHKVCEVGELVSRKLCAEMEKHFSFTEIITLLNCIIKCVCEQIWRSLRIETKVSAENANAIPFVLHLCLLIHGEMTPMDWCHSLI